MYEVFSFRTAASQDNMSNMTAYYINEVHPVRYLENCIRFVCNLLSALFDDRNMQNKEGISEDFADTLSATLSLTQTVTLSEETRTWERENRRSVGLEQRKGGGGKKFGKVYMCAFMLHCSRIFLLRSFAALGLNAFSRCMLPL